MCYVFYSEVPKKFLTVTSTKNLHEDGFNGSILPNIPRFHLGGVAGCVNEYILIKSNSIKWRHFPYAFDTLRTNFLEPILSSEASFLNTLMSHAYDGQVHTVAIKIYFTGIISEHN
jgi:hypothetical protein